MMMAVLINNYDNYFSRVRSYIDFVIVYKKFISVKTTKRLMWPGDRESRKPHVLTSLGMAEGKYYRGHPPLPQPKTRPNTRISTAQEIRVNHWFI